MAELEDLDNIAEILLPCTSCSRTFRPEALAKHAKVCEKTLMKKRKTFDSAKQRLQGTDLEAYVNVSPAIKNKKSDISLPNTPAIKTATSTSKWKEKHLDLAKTIQAARKMVDTTPLKTKTKPSDHQQCPHCERFFGPKAYGRHVDWCKGQQYKFKPSVVNNEARERLQVRTGYRAPLPNKMLTRDKYQRGGPRSRDSSLTRINELSKPKMNEPVARSQTFSMGKSPEKSRHFIEKRTPSQPKITIKSPGNLRKAKTDIEQVLPTPMKINTTLPKILSSANTEKK